MVTIATHCQCIIIYPKHSLDNSIVSPTQPRFLVILNPFSGTKKSVEKYRKYVEPMFEMAGITVVREIITGI